MMNHDLMMTELHLETLAHPAQVEAEDVLEKESSVHERILSPIAAASRASEAPPTLQRRGIGGVAPFGRQFSMARMAARIRRPRRCERVARLSGCVFVQVNHSSQDIYWVS